MKIAFVTVGTRGDVQPYIAVARALMARGHDVWIAATEEHEELVRGYGVGFRKLRGNFREMLKSDLGRAWLTSGDSPFKYARYARELFVPMQQDGCADADAAVEGADGIAFYGLAIGAIHAAERRKLPIVALSPWPMVPTREIVPLGAPYLWNVPGVFKEWAGHVVAWLAFRGLNEPHLAYRKSVGLPPWESWDLLHAIHEAEIPTVHLFSEALLRRPADWAARHSVAGFAFTPPVAYEPPRALVDFLDAGPPPVYVGFGSMTGFDPTELAELTTAAVRRAGVRAVVATGWESLSLPPSDDVFVIDDAPHEWLFPRVSAVVHHGGVGTFAAGLRAGKPTVIAAFFGDQPFWARLNEERGTGPRGLLRTAIDEENLGAAIREALDGPYRANAEAIATRLAAEDGAARAAELVELNLAARRPW